MPFAPSTIDQLLALLRRDGPLTPAEAAAKLFPNWHRAGPEAVGKTGELLAQLSLERQVRQVMIGSGVGYVAEGAAEAEPRAEGQPGALFKAISPAGLSPAVGPRPSALDSSLLDALAAGPLEFLNILPLVLGGATQADASLEDLARARAAVAKAIERGDVVQFVPPNEVRKFYRLKGQGAFQEDDSMAKAATKKKPASAQKTTSYIKTIPVSFGGVSIGQGTARIGIRVDRSNLGLSEAEKYLCGRRLVGRVRVESGNGDPSQQDLVPDLHHEIAGAFDLKQMGVSPERYSAGLTFSTAEINLAELGFFAKANGRLYIETAAEIPDDAEVHDGDADRPLIDGEE